MKAHYMAAHASLSQKNLPPRQQAAADVSNPALHAPLPRAAAGKQVRAAAAVESGTGQMLASQMGMAQMLSQDTAKAKLSRTALVQEVSALKDRLTAIAKATGYNMQHQGAASNSGLSGKAAANDLHNFYSKLTTSHGASDGTTRVITNSRDADRKLGEYFNSLPTGIEEGRGGGDVGEALPKGAQNSSAYNKEYVADVEKTYGKMAATNVVQAQKEGRTAHLSRKQGQGTLLLPHPKC